MTLAREVAERRSGRYGHTRVTAYRCGSCGGFHIGEREKKGKRR